MLWYDGSIAQAGVPAVADNLVQFGAIGVLAFLALYAVNKLFTRQVAAHDKDIARADAAETQLRERPTIAIHQETVTRAERLETELRNQNQLIQERMIVELTRATEVMASVSALLASKERV